MKNNSFNTCHRVLNAMLSFHQIDKDIAAIERLPEDDDGHRKETFREGEFERIISTTKGREVQDNLKTLLFTGMRVGTSIRTRHENIDLKNEDIFIPHYINKGKLFPYSIKIDGRIFDVLLFRQQNSKDIAIQVLSDLKNKGFQIVNDNVDEASQFLFPGVWFLGPDNYYIWLLKNFNNACKNADISDRRMHDLRRTFATELYRKTPDLLAISKALGHRSAYATLIYLGLETEDIRDLFQPLVHNYSREELEIIQFS
jgi:integrase